jgi:flagellar hook assembly protein FlgD
VVNAEVIQLCTSLEAYLSKEDFEKFMALVKAEAQIPVEYHLSQNYPNPFNPTTSIQYSVVSGQSPPHVSLRIYSLLGREVRALVDEPQETGYHSVTWDGTDERGQAVSSGVYFYRLTAERYNDVKKMILLK